MPDLNLPRTVSISLAAAIRGKSDRAGFKRVLIDTGLVETETSSGGRVRVVLASLERVMGKPITAEAFLAAIASLQPARDAANRRARGSVTDVRSPAAA